MVHERKERSCSRKHTRQTQHKQQHNQGLDTVMLAQQIQSQHPESSQGEIDPCLLTYGECVNEHAKAMVARNINRSTTLPLPTMERWIREVDQDADLKFIKQALTNREPLKANDLKNPGYFQAWKKREPGSRRRNYSGIRRAQDPPYTTTQENRSPRMSNSNGHCSLSCNTTGRTCRILQNLLQNRHNILVTRNVSGNKDSSPRMRTLQSSQHDVTRRTKYTASNII